MEVQNIICKVPQLENSQNYIYWRAQMETHLKAYDLYRFVENDHRDENHDDGDDDGSLTQRRDRLALSQIHQAVGSSIFRIIVDAKTAKEAWDIIEKTFQEDIRNNVFTLERTFQTIKMESSESVDSYFARLGEIKTEMWLNGHSLPDDVFVDKVLNTLPEKFDTVVTVIQETRDVFALTPEELKSLLLVHEGRINKRMAAKGGWMDNLVGGPAEWSVLALSLVAVIFFTKKG